MVYRLVKFYFLGVSC